MGSCGYTVIIKRKEVVAAALPMQEHWLPMSNLDLLLPALDFGIFLCYKKSPTPKEQYQSLTNQTHETSTTSAVGVVKSALAQALVSFFALAGEVVQNSLGEPELLCNNRGVDFIHAYVNLELKDIDLYHPDESVHGKLVPIKNQGVLSIQVTELKCGGLVIGCTFDHRVTDAHSANMFLTTWAEIAQSKPMASHSIPSFRRSLLTPRRPGHYHPSIDNMYLFLSSLPPPKDPEPITNNNHLISRIYYIPAEEIDRLQSLASSNGTRRSKLESFSALLWKLIAEGGRDSKKICKMGVVVNGRERLSCTGNNHKAPESMQNYFGNVLTVPYAEASADELNRMPLNRIAEAVHAFLEGANTEEHFSGLIDWVELHRPEQAVAKVYFKQTDNEEAVVVSSGQRFPISSIDFGWGRPDFGSYHFPWGGQTGYVMPMPSVSRIGDWVVYMHLLEKHLDLVEKEAPHVFRPLTPAYLNLIA